MRIVGYILDENKNPVPVYDIMEWGEWMGTQDRVVRQDRLSGTFISTVFLGLDHGFSRSSAPVVFETMIFNKQGSDTHCWRYSTWNEAWEGHERAIEIVFREQAVVYVKGVWH